MILNFISYPILILLLLLTATEFYPVLLYGVYNIGVYQWMLLGAAAYFIIRRFSFFARNEKWMQTTSHEATHAIVGIMFFHKIHSLEANEDHGVVYHSGRKFGDIFISLSPYCLPIFTYGLLLFRIIGSTSMLYVFDILIGFSLAFHILCFYKQTSLKQPDIQGQGYFRAFLFLFVSWLFNSTIILLSIRKGIVEAVIYIFEKYWNTIVDFWNFIF